MSSFKNIVLKTILTYSLSNREVFVEKVSAVLERYRNDEKSMKELSDFLFNSLSDFKENMTQRDNMAYGVNKGNEDLNTTISELTKAIEELRTEIRNIKK